MTTVTLLDDKKLVDYSLFEEKHIADARHSDLDFDGSRFLRIQRTDARVDEDQYHLIDFAKYWLPPTDVHAKPQRLTDRPELVETVVAVIEKYFQRVKRSKSRHRRAAFMAANLVKFFEYLWLNNVYKLESVTPDELDRLARLLAQGDWHKALDFNRRTEASINAPDRALATSILRIPRYRLRALIGDEVRQAIGSNLSSQEASRYLQKIYDEFKHRGFSEIGQVTFDDGAQPGMGQSMIRQTLATVNYLLNLPGGLGLRFEPYPNAFKLSKSIGRAGSRTKNLGAAEAGLIINEAYQWLYVYGPLVSDLVAGICSQVVIAHAEGREVLGYKLEEWLHASPIRTELESLLGGSIEHLDGGSSTTISLRRLLLSTYTACFVLIAVMNARRRDEITHRKFGMHKGCVQVLDEELGIFSASFYIEKTYQSYLDFYVNKTTWNATKLLEKFQESFDSLAMAISRPKLDDFPEKERSIFGYFRLSRIKGVSRTRCWYSFDSNTNNGQAAFFLRRALGSDYSVGPSAHMFRRLYCLIFMYQHEIPSLPALSQQLAHEDLSTTQIYFTDPTFRVGSERIEMKIDYLKGRRAKAFAAHLRDTTREMAIVSDEKLLETILAIISDEPTSGGYPKFIKRFYRRLLGRVDFRKLDIEARASSLKKIAKARGHAPKPMRHGQCMVGTVSPALGARCRGGEGLIESKNASPSVCGKCPYHYLSKSYLRNLEDDLEHLEEIASDSLSTDFAKERARIDAENLRVVILHHQVRLSCPE